MSWFKKPLNIGITVGAAILVVVAISLIIWGVTHHTEGEMLQVCWVNDEARYVSDVEGDQGACSDPEEVRWAPEQVPIKIVPNDESDPARVKVLRSAITDLNRELGFELFQYLEEGLDGPVLVRLDGALGPDMEAPGWVRHFKIGGSLRAIVSIRSDVASEDRMLFIVLRHELLHVAGLAHDDFTLSIMYPIQHEEWDMGAMSTAHTTDVDRSNLRRLYMRQ